MNFRKIVPWLAAFCCLWAMAGPAFATQVESDSVYCFSQEDFAADQNLAGICIRSLPDAQFGTVMLGCRVLQAGDVLTAEQAARMVCVGQDDLTVGYLPVFADHVALGIQKNMMLFVAIDSFTKGTFSEFKQFLREKRPDLKIPE